MLYRSLLLLSLLFGLSLPAGAAGTEYRGLITAASGVTPGTRTNGFLTLQLTGSAFSGTVKVDGLSLAFTGTVDNTGLAHFSKAATATQTLARVNKPALLLGLRFDLSPGGTGKATGTLDEQTATGSRPLSVIEADRVGFDGKTPATSTTAASYTCALTPGSANGLTPQGDGVAMLTVTKDGKVTFAGTLADGTAITCSSVLSATRTTAVFASLHVNRGAFGAALALDEAPTDTDVKSTQSWWFRPFITGQVYPQGWPEGLSPEIIGARYGVTPGASVLHELDPLPIPNASLAFADGGLVTVINKALHVTKANAVTKADAKDASFSAALSAASGLLSGSFLHSDGKRYAFKIIVLQKGANARGFGHFVGATLAGSARLSYTKLPHSAVVITELMAKNVSSITDEDGAHSDWIELYNPGSADVDLTDWCLTDSATNLAKWRFPAVTLGARQFMIVFASGKDRRVPGANLHTSFGLDANGEYLALVRPDGVTIEQEFAPAFPVLHDDESYGVSFVSASYLKQGSTARYLVPSNASLGSSWTATTFNDAAWKSGKTGLGFGMNVPGFTLRHIAVNGANVFVDSLAKATAIIALPKGHANILGEATTTSLSLNFLGDGSEGHYDSNAALPYATTENYVIHATGTIIISVAGQYVFGLNSDDGGRIRIDGHDVMVDDSNHGPTDHLGAPVTLSAGPHSVEVIMWEGAGGDELEFFAAKSTETVWSDAFKLVGGTGGLAVYTTPGSSSAMSNLIGTDLKNVMLNKNASCYVRMSFTASDVSTVAGLTLNMRYNDGFIAYLNGTEIARRNAPATALFNSAATATRDLVTSMEQETIDVSAFRSLLVNGKNVLAVQGMNDSISDAAFLVQPELFATETLRSATAARYLPVGGGLTATPGSANGVPVAVGFVADPRFSVPHGAYTSALAVAISSSTSGAAINYTLDGSEPTATHGRRYSGPISITKTSVVRAIAFKSGWQPSKSVTQSYLFYNDIIRQQTTGARPGSGWAADGLNGQAASYGMDPRVVNSSNSEIGGSSRAIAALAALPSVSLVMNLPDLFDQNTGIYVNSGGRGVAWERPGSIEMIGDPNTATHGFQVNCGVRVRGGYSRDSSNPKHAFHLYFRSQYGDSQLTYPLFGAAGAGSFDKIDLRTSQNYSWAFGGDGNNTMMREETARELLRAMGNPGSHDRYFHLYLNGVYWGIYDFDESMDAGFASTYLGGGKSDYDTVKWNPGAYNTVVADGTIDAWQQLWNKSVALVADPSNANYFAMQGLAADGVTPTADPVLLDTDALIDYMLLTFWTGNLDGATSAFLSDSAANNWIGIRDRTPGSTGFKYFAHDFEHTFFNVDEDRTGPFISGTGDLDHANPMWLHHNLRSNAEYRMRWADRVQKHLFNGGALSAASVAGRFERRRAELDTAIIAESARWGDSKLTSAVPPLGRTDWLSAVSYLIESYAPARGSRVIAQLRADGLYPSLDVPVIDHASGTLSLNTEIKLSATDGTIYYTLDGSDPRLIGGAVNPVAQTYVSATTNETLVPAGQAWHYLADGSNQGTAWRASAFDDSTWPAGAAELGYGDGDEATTVPFVDADPIAAGTQKNATTYFRTSFSVTNASAIQSATISLKYDDAAIVYVNGVEAVRTDNIASNAAYNDYASSAAPDENATFDFVLDPARLVSGVNTIAVEVHQATPDSSDISFQLALKVTRVSSSTPLIMSTAGTQRLRARAFKSGEWSAISKATYEVVSMADLAVTGTATGPYNAGNTGKTCFFTVSNVGTERYEASGGVRMDMQVPAGLAVTSAAGDGWTCALLGGVVIATRSGSLEIGASYPPVTLTFDISTAAEPSLSLVASLVQVVETNTSNNTATLALTIGGQGTQELRWEPRDWLSDSEGYITAALSEDAVASVALRRHYHATGSLTVHVRSIMGSAKSPADFDAMDQDVTFADGETLKIISLILHTSAMKSGSRSFTLELSNPSAGTLAKATTKVIIFGPSKSAPTLSILSPAANAKLRARASDVTTVTVRGTGTNGLKTVQCSFDDGAFETGDFIATAQAQWQFHRVLSPGVHHIAVRGVDYRGNLSSVVKRTVQIIGMADLNASVLPLANQGTITTSPALVQPGRVEIGKTYTFTTNATLGYRFDHWSSALGTTSDPKLTLTITGDTTISASMVTNPFASPVSGSYSGLIRSDLGVLRSHANNGALSLTLSTTGVCTGTLRLEGESLPLVGQFSNSDPSTITVNRKNKTPLLLSFTCATSPLGWPMLTGQVSEVGRDATTLIASLSCDRSYFDGRAVKTTAGSLVLAMPVLSTGAAYPANAGSATLRWDTGGVATLSGKLADATSFTLSAPMSRTREVPAFVNLYKSRGSLSGPVLIDSHLGAPGVYQDTLPWFRPVQPGSTVFPFGWPEGIDTGLK